MSTNTNIKYIQLLQQIATNPLRPKVAAAVDIVADFEKDTEAVRLDGRLSPQGKREKAQGNLKKALRDLRDTRKTALEEHHAKTETMRGKVVRPAFDKADIVGAMARRELRDASRAMPFGRRAALMSGPTRSIAFIDAILEFENDPWMCGVDVFNPNELQVFEAAKEERLRDLHGPLLDAIAERDAVESEARMILDVARNDLKLHSGMDDRVFADFAKPIDNGQNSVWLKKFTEDGREVIRVIDVANHGAHVASEREILDGKYYRDHADYLADRAA
jgi:hypothetical protein